MRSHFSLTRWVLPPLAAILLLCAAWPQKGASQQTPVLNQEQALLHAWNEIGRKLVAMAEDFPEDKYDFRPTAAQRTFAEQLLHVAGSNDLFSDVAMGRKAVDDEDRSHYPGKAPVVAYLKKSFEKGAAAIRAKNEASLAEIVLDPDSGRRMPLGSLGWELVEHSGEHYGQLVVYYRVAGLIPPESRPKK